MPLWHIYTPAGAYNREDKKALAEALMKIYVDNADLPKFYVNVIFHEIAEEDFLIGAEPRTNFVRLVGEHIARRLPAELYRPCMAMLEAAIAPFVAERGYDWEIHVDETPFELWQVQGLIPPSPESEAERSWARANRAAPYEAATMS